MTKAQIDRIVNVRGYVKGDILHRDRQNGRMVGIDEIRYRSGDKPNLNRIRVIHDGVLNEKY